MMKKGKRTVVSKMLALLVLGSLATAALVGCNGAENADETSALTESTTILRDSDATVSTPDTPPIGDPPASGMPLPPFGEGENAPPKAPPDGDPVTTEKPQGGAEQPTTTSPVTVPPIPSSGIEPTGELLITCVSGTEDAYTVSGTTVTFTELKADSVYSVSGVLNGNIVIDVGDSFSLDLELCGVSVTSDSTSPITVISGEEVSLIAKEGYANYVNDNRAAVSEEDTTQYAAAIRSQVDLEIRGQGSLTVVSKHNKGIHTKDDLTVKNLTLSVICTDNALKGNDSVTLVSGRTTLIATAGDAIKTENTDISDKGNQRGNVEILGGIHKIYAACDGIDAAHNVVIKGTSADVSVYTDRYSDYSEEVTATDAEQYYLRYTGQNYKYSVKYTYGDGSVEWVNAVYHSTVRSGRNTYYYYTVEGRAEAKKMTVYAYSAAQTQGQENDYASVSSALTPNTAYDTLALTNRNGSLSVSWTNYTTAPGGGGMGGWPGGGMNEGNSDKGDYSTKGIKAGNEIVISGGTVNIEAYDDAIHASSGTTLENGATSVGNVTVSGGTVTVFSNDDGIHADGVLTVSGGTVKITGSYEGLEGNNVRISGGDVSVISKDDGINAPATSGEAIVISGGKLYIYAGGDGIDSNSRTSYGGIAFSGGKTVVICTSGGNSAIDSEQGYKYTAGQVVAIMPSGGMTSEATRCSNFSSVATKSTLSLTSDKYLNVTVSGSTVASVRMPANINSAMVIYLGSNAATYALGTSFAGSVNADGVYWK